MNIISITRKILIKYRNQDFLSKVFPAELLYISMTKFKTIKISRSNQIKVMKLYILSVENCIPISKEFSVTFEKNIF